MSPRAQVKDDMSLSGLTSMSAIHLFAGCQLVLDLNA